jgi:hypothetical protein
MGFLLLGREQTPSPAPGDLFDPLCGMTAEAIGSDASDHDGKLRFAHCGFSLIVRFMREHGRARGWSVSSNNRHELFRFYEQWA